jgi:hypothetical protein
MTVPTPTLSRIFLQISASLASSAPSTSCGDMVFYMFVSFNLTTTGILPVYSYTYLLAGSWINCMIFMLEVVLAVRYFRHSSRSLLHRAGMSAILASDTLCTFTICAKIYLLVSLHPSQPRNVYPRFSAETLTVILCSTYATASLAQLFLGALYFNLWVIFQKTEYYI